MAGAGGPAHGVVAEGALGSAGPSAAEVARGGPARTLNENSPVELMMARLRELGAPIYGTKREKWARILRAEAEIAREEEIARLLSERQVRRRDGGGVYVPTLLPAPRAPSDLERFTHELSHCPPEAWCEFCVMGTMACRPHRASTLEDRERSRPEVQMDYMFLDSEMRVVDKVDA